jgi:hypothetical protein
MDRARAAKRVNGEVARIEALLDGALADEIGGRRVVDLEDAGGGLLDREPDLLAQPGDRSSRCRLVERHPAIEEAVGAYQS